MHDQRMTGLPLFDWRPACAVLPFPARARIRLVRETAAGMLTRDGEDAAAFWRASAAMMHQQFVDAGCGESVAWREVKALFYAVQTEMLRSAPQGSKITGNYVGNHEKA